MILKSIQCHPKLRNARRENVSSDLPGSLGDTRRSTANTGHPPWIELGGTCPISVCFSHPCSTAPVAVQNLPPDSCCLPSPACWSFRPSRWRTVPLTVQPPFMNVQPLFVNVQPLFVNVQPLFVNVQPFLPPSPPGLDWIISSAQGGSPSVRAFPTACSR